MTDTTPPKEVCVEEEDAVAAEESSEILQELKLFWTETPRNFGLLTKEVSDIKKNLNQLKTRMDIAEERIAHNEDRDMDLTRVLFHQCAN